MDPRNSSSDQLVHNGGETDLANDPALCLDVAVRRIWSPAATEQECPPWLIAEGDPDVCLRSSVSAKVLDDGSHEP